MESHLVKMPRVRPKSCNFATCIKTVSFYMCDPYPYTLSPIPAEGAGGIIYPAIDWKCFLKHVEPISFDLVSSKVFVWSLTVFMHFMSCTKTVIGLTGKDSWRGGGGGKSYAP